MIMAFQLSLYFWLSYYSKKDYIAKPVHYKGYQVRITGS